MFSLAQENQPTQQERDAGLVATDIINSHYPVLDVRRYGADETGKTASDAAIANAIAVATVQTSVAVSAPIFPWITTLEGNTVYFPRGVFRVDSTITVPDRVSFRGEGALSTIICAGSSFSADTLVDCVDGTSAIFDSQFWGIKFHASNDADIDNVIHLEAWQERCGIFFCDIAGNQSTNGVLISDVSSGAAGFKIQNTTFSGFSNTTSAIHVDNTVPNAFQLVLDTVTINSSGAATNGVLMDNGWLEATALHVETCTNGVHFAGGSGGTIKGMTGASDVTNLVTIGASFNGNVDAFDMDVNGGTNTLDDNVTSRDIAGSVAGFHYPFSPQSTSATPSVAQKPAVLRTFYNSVATDITDFTGGPHEFILRTQDANTTIDINGNAAINRADGVDTDYTPGAAAWYHVWDDRGTWIIDLVD